MIMSDKHICDEYKAAKKRNEMIGTLADQNCCTRDDIKFILLSNGCGVTGVKSASLIARLAEIGLDANGEKIKPGIAIPAPEGTNEELKKLSEKLFGANKENPAAKETKETAGELAETHEVVIDIKPADLENEEQPKEEKTEYRGHTEQLSIPQQSLVTLTIPESIAKLLGDTVMHRLDALEEEITLVERDLEALKGGIELAEKKLEAKKNEYRELSNYLKKETI